MSSRYKEIAEKAIAEAERIGGSLQDFAEGMEELSEAIQERAQWAREEAEENAS